MLVRFTNWPSRLESFILDAHNKRFQYGCFDCCLFVADAVQIMTGTDIAAPLRGYSSRASALRAVSAFTGRASVQAAAEVLTRAHFMTEIPVMHASRGDMALIARGRDFSMGLVGMGGRLIIAMRRGTAEIPVERACRAWRV